MENIPGVRRRYNKLVANELLEDFALRFTAKRARKWSAIWIANTALGIVSFLVLEALAGTITLNYGVINSLWAIGAVSVVVIFSGVPICYYAARYGVDIDLLSRGAGFGYIGSTIASLIYASFTFIFFALEAAIMSMALELLFDIPLFWGYMLSSVIVIPLVILGITNIGRFQMWSQPLWLMMQLIPLFYVFSHPDSNLEQWLSYSGQNGGTEFDWRLFGPASAVLLSVVTQIGEQVDFLRFLPSQEQCGRGKWWAAMLLGGPGWILFGAAKMVLGSFLAWLAIRNLLPMEVAADPAHMYRTVFAYVTDNPKLALLCAGLFVIISQLKINVANAYAGSLAWSNFFSRLTHHHPGRVVWMVFNVMIALLLMELGVYQLLDKTLQIYSVLVLAWIGSIVADLVINKPLGLSPKMIEFKRSRLYDINPVGVGSMTIASVAGFCAHFDLFGDVIRAFASYLAFVLPFVTAPLIALLTHSRYYLIPFDDRIQSSSFRQHAIELSTGTHQCCVCEYMFEHEDMAWCPAYHGPICSLCCSLDVRCHDQCRPQATFFEQLNRTLRPYLPESWLAWMSSSVSQFFMVMLIMSLVIAGILGLAYSQVPLLAEAHMHLIAAGLTKAFVLVLIPIGIISWLFVLARKSRNSAMAELKSHTQKLTEEMAAHRKTASALEQAKRSAETANNAKSRYLAGLSHELRTPLNVLLGYAQLFSQDQSLDARQREYAQTLKRNGKHLADLLEGLLEISKIEAGRLELHRDIFSLKELLEQLTDMYVLQAAHKGLDFTVDIISHLPDFIVADKQRLRQILLNLLSNAVKYTEQGRIVFRVTYRNQVARFSVEDTGIGISTPDQTLIFKPFERIKTDQTLNINGTGLGLTISAALASLMGGDIRCDSEIGRGSTFTLTLLLTQVDATKTGPPASPIIGYQGQKRTILVVDDIDDQRRLISNILTPMGFTVLEAESAAAALSLTESAVIDLFILDIFMPQMSGWQLAARLRRREMNQPIIMLSANLQEFENNHPEKLHNDYLTKPVVVAELLGKIERLLQLNWIERDQDVQSPMGTTGCQASTTAKIPSPEVLKKLRDYAEIGFMSAFRDKLDQLERSGKAGETFVQQMRDEVQQCNFEKIINLLDNLSHESS
jgi:signal transduction histidine kinase/FixJ family two-component response regulator/cytosine/uracil/thiamine/allantoin permease